MMNTNANFKVYQASAGSGKTFTLIKEYLKLCLKDKASVGNYQNILAITFTNATANEMKEKIVNNLCEITGLKPAKQEDMKLTLMKELNITEEELKSNAQALLTCIMHDYSNFCVSTIDAFVQK
ncbi:MAG: ATP-dependent exonuclase V beta subunit, helicase and exonuclease domain-containing, partial [bacterium P3]